MSPEHDFTPPPDEQPESWHRLAILGTFTSMLAHEMNNLMTPVVGYVQEALRTGDAGLMRTALATTQRQVSRSLALCERLLALARGEAVSAGPAPVREIVDNALLALARPLDKDGIDLRVDVPLELRVRSDGVLAEQILLNLLVNARHALASGGEVTLRAWAEPPAAVIEVADNGPGLSPGLDERLAPFLAGGAGEQPLDWQSVGLGLAMCRLVAQRLGGALEAVDRPEGGACFRLRLPLA